MGRKKINLAEKKELNIRAILAKRQRTAPEIRAGLDFVNSVRKTDPELLKFRKMIVGTDSDFLISLFADIQNGYSPNILVCGRARKGKTFTAAVIANFCSVFLYYKWWDPKLHYHFTPKAMLESMSDDGYEIKVSDEAGAMGSGINRREWFSQMNQVMDFCLQTQGMLQDITIFALPTASDASVDIRKAVDWLIYMKKKGLAVIYKIDKKEDQMVKDLNDFKKVYIETLPIKKEWLPKDIWEYIDTESKKLKKTSRKEVIASLNNPKGKLKGNPYNWVHGYGE